MTGFTRRPRYIINEHGPQLTDFSPSSAVVARAEPDVGDLQIVLGSSHVGLSVVVGLFEANLRQHSNGQSRLVRRAAACMQSWYRGRDASQLQLPWRSTAS